MVTRLIIDNWVLPQQSQLSIGMGLYRIVSDWGTVLSVSVEYWHETQPNSQQLGTVSTVSVEYHSGITPQE